MTETEQLSRLVRTLVGPHDLPPVAPTLWLHVDAAGPVEITLVDIGSGTLTFHAALRSVPTRRCMLTVKVAEAARLDFPVVVTADGDRYRAQVSGPALILRRRTTPNAKLQEALAAA